MEKVYEPHQIEKKWSESWESHGDYQPSGTGNPYCIMLPPPNVTGTLHMGHGFQQTLMDTLIRRNRMLGHNTLWQAGTDHAGIATQMVVERRLAKSNISRHDLGRDKFIDKIWEWREESGDTITNQIRRMGASVDWSRERFSMDKGICTATREAFIRLYNEGLIYRGKRLVNWDPALCTAISDLEVKNELEDGYLWHIKYPLSESDEHIVIATTRPETLLGDTGVAVHPDDERYQHLIGKTIALPLTDRHIPIVADDAVDPEFGTGCVKVTPAHDFNDYEIGRRHDLPVINILTSDAHLNKACPEAYQEMSVQEGRKQIVIDLEKLNLMEKVEKHSHNVPRGDRSGVIIEPMLTDQWFVKASELAKPAIEAVESGKVEFVPANWKKTYLQWLYNIQDWCISRQLWWGHRIPVWYDDQDNIYVGHSEEDVRERYNLSAQERLRPDEDVLDTWFSSSLWPFATLGWPEKTPELDTFYPGSVLVTGFDIIFFWVARMVMMGIKLMGDIPFKQVYVHGLIRDSHGQKMSKSKGNVLDPLDLVDGIELEALVEKRVNGLMQPDMQTSIEKTTREEYPDGIPSFGTDAVRFTFCALAGTGRDINFDLGRTEGYRNFCNKLWNAARYVLMNTEEHELGKSKQDEYSLADLWIQNRLQQTVKTVNDAFNQYRFDLIAQALYEFTWNEYCGWYLELSKCILNNPNSTPAQLQGTRRTLLSVLETLLRLMHPVMPYITEEIWHTVARLLSIKGNTIMLQPYPEFSAEAIDESAQIKIDWLKEVISAIRNVRSELGLPPSKTISVILHKGNETDKQNWQDCEPYIRTLTKIEQSSWHDGGELPASANAVTGDLEIHIPLSGIIDKDSEIDRLTKEIMKLTKEKEKSEKKLQNPNYVNKAPEDVVEKERLRLQQSEMTLQKLKEHCERIEAL